MNNIRRATIKDVPEIARLLVQIDNVHAEIRPDIFQKNHPKYNEEQIAAIIEDDDTPVYVAEANEDELYENAKANENTPKLAGHLFAIKKEDELLGKHLYIDDLCVDESERRKGIAAKLMQFVEEDAKKQGIKRITLNVWKGNTEGESFYEKTGFKTLKTTLEKML